MNIIEAIAAQQPRYYAEYIEPATRFYINDPSVYFNAKKSAFKRLRKKYRLHLPFKEVVFYYKELAVVHLRGLEPGHQLLKGTPFQDDGGISLNFILGAGGGVSMLPLALLLHPTKNLVSPVEADPNGSFEYDKLPTDLKSRMDNLCTAVAYTILTLGESWTEYVDEPVKLNKKRARQGKPPIHSHHILHLGTKTTRSRASGDGSHSSPAMHIRRGHFRRYQSGNVVWVRDTVVGKEENGVITKNYAL